MDEKISKLMKSLNISEQEAIELVESDKRIDKGEKLFELDPELAVGAKKARQADRKQSAPVKRERKADEDKRAIVGRITSTLENWFKSNEYCTFNACTEINIINPEREIEFTYNGKKYKIVLSAPRS